MASSPSSFDDTINVRTGMSSEDDIRDFFAPSSQAGSDFEPAQNQRDEIGRTIERRRDRTSKAEEPFQVPAEAVRQGLFPAVENGVDTWDTTYEEGTPYEYHNQQEYWDDHPEEARAKAYEQALQLNPAEFEAQEVEEAEVSDADTERPATMDTNDASMEDATNLLGAATALDDLADVILDAAVAPIDAHDAHTSTCAQCQLEEHVRTFARLEYATLEVQNDVLRCQARVLHERVLTVQSRLRQAASGARRTALATEGLILEDTGSSRALRERLAKAGHLVNTTLKENNKGILEEMAVVLKGMADYGSGL
ncbi:hypothetical protein R3P38DRAFT_2777447 [Favolaschia claudopus]|uniref:Uncharacterized protein n=1 Tax=Favolaschia claudopus TaxID=2862362 RepID=A0AAW0BK28_9AGAR